MKLQQILSSVFPRIARSKSEKSGSQCGPQNRRHRSKSDRQGGKTAGDYAPRPSACRSVHLEDPKNIADKSEEATPKLIQTFCYETFDNVFDCSAGQTPIAITSSFSYYDDDDDKKTDFKEDFDGVENTQQFEENQNSPIFVDLDAATISTSKLRRKIRTNPWLQSPTTSLRHYFDGSFDVLPSSTANRRSPSLTPEDVIGFPKSISDRLLSFSMTNDNDSFLGKPPGWAMDSGSEGYATSLIRSPSSTDLDDGGGLDDSALASSVSSESDLYWMDRSPSEEFDLRSKRPEMSTGKQHPSGEISIDTEEGDSEKIFDNTSAPRNAGETANPNEERVSNRSSSLPKISCDYVNTSEEHSTETTFRSVYKPHPATGLSLVTSDVRFELPLANISESSQKVTPSGEEEQEQEKYVVKEDPTGHDVPSTERSLEINSDYGDQGCQLKPVDEDNKRLVTARSLVEVSQSLQDKVEALHEQKYYVDAVFMRARQLDRQRAAELARLRAQLTSKKKQTMLQRLQELRQTLASQSIRIQSTYDTILWKQWPRCTT